MSAKRLQVRVQRREQFFEQRLQSSLLLAIHQLSLVRPSKKVPHLIQKSARNSYEPLMIDRGRTSIALRDIGTNTVRRSHQLFADRITRKPVPCGSHLPAEISQIFGHAINPQPLQSKLLHSAN